jgi:hypothetical protein
VHALASRQQSNMARTQQGLRCLDCGAIEQVAGLCLVVWLRDPLPEMGTMIHAEAVVPVRHPEAGGRFAILAASTFTPESWRQPLSRTQANSTFQPGYHTSVHPFQVLVKPRSPHLATYNKRIRREIPALFAWSCERRAGALCLHTRRP